MSIGESPTGGIERRPAIAVAVRCPCGLEITSTTPEDLVIDVNRHLTEQHPRVAGHYDDDDILALSYPRPVAPTDRDRQGVPQ
ncbi:hypothetical protein GORHZ_171_00080 [Gordonia rhizosphera NBRC 16068]|uniref:DUF1059 domain-containing protein n=1 Tax=Gordonia rhizosphera NBRC 16068 TaxID=1108045 RepID=K6VZL3_9ACTN|nr:hypothetical protein GORHZ_171_00080 [Gordonia rhizosphera NBRC 16068]